MSSLNTPSRRDAKRSRATILNSAEVLFSSRGYERVSLADIAELSRVSRGLPSYFFGDKDKLYRAVMERAAMQNRRTVLDAVRSMKGNKPRQILLKLIDRYIEYLAANPRVVRLLQWETLETRNRDPSGGAFGVPLGVFLEASELLSQCMHTKRLRGLGVSDLLQSIVAMCLYPFAMMPTEHTKRKSFVQEHKRHVSAIVLRAIGEKA